jgi:tetratricopeptide (TPR) repeat protein
MRALSLKDITADPKRTRIFMVVCVALASVLVYANSLGNEFAYDDVVIIQSRETAHGVGNIPVLVTEAYWVQDYLPGGIYRPLTMANFALDWTIWNGGAFGFHLLNVVLHAVVSSLVVLFLLLFFPWWAALAGGLVFAVHPIHTEAVANIVGRAEMLTALFVLTACILYIRAMRDGRISAGAIVAIAACYALASFSKEVAVVLPGLLLATDLPLWSRGQAGSFKSYVRTRIPLFAVLTGVLLLVFAARWAVLGAAVESVPHLTFALDDSFTTRLFTMARVWPRYFELLAFPLELSADYSPALILPVEGLTPLGALGFLLLFASLAIAALTFRRAPELSMALVWAGLSILPVSNLIITAEIVLAERTLYLPSIAVSVAVALALAKAAPARRKWLAAGLAAWVVGFSVVTVKRNPVWYNTHTLFENLRQQHPESVRLLYALGLDMYKQGEWELAQVYFGLWMKVWPYHAPWLAQYAAALADHGEFARADSLVSAAIRMKPKIVTFHYLRAIMLIDGGNNEDALRAIDESVEIVGVDADFHGLRADAYERLGDIPAALRAQEAAIEGWKDEATWLGWSRLARLHAAAGDTAAALETLAVARGKEGAQVEVADSLERVWSGLP